MCRGGGTSNHTYMPVETPIDHSAFEFTDDENLFERVLHQRFMRLVADRHVKIHEIKENGNAFGEFLFVTLSRRDKPDQRQLVFYGLGYHDQRERWIHEYWRWYESYIDKSGTVVPKQRAIEQIKAREEWVKSMAASEPKPTHRGEMYALLADLTDEDGAITEMEDFGWALIGLDDEE